MYVQNGWELSNVFGNVTYIIQMKYFHVEKGAARSFSPSPFPEIESWFFGFDMFNGKMVKFTTSHLKQHLNTTDYQPVVDSFNLIYLLVIHYKSKLAAYAV